MSDHAPSSPSAPAPAPPPTPRLLAGDSGIPIYLQKPSSTLPPDDCAYLVTADGLFLYRRHPFFESAVPTGPGSGPDGLAGQKPFLRLRFPLIPRGLFQQAIAFARELYLREGAEVIVFFTVDPDGRVDLLVPWQTATVQLWRGEPPQPVHLRYDLPDLPPGTVVFGDLHSHGNHDAYSSATDVVDEAALNGLHLVVGRVDRAVPVFHAEAIVDGHRFGIAHLESLLEPVQPHVRAGDERRTGNAAEFPRDWISRVRIRHLPDDPVPPRYASVHGPRPWTPVEGYDGPEH